jgi:hypothetical protein
MMMAPIVGPVERLSLAGYKDGVLLKSQRTGTAQRFHIRRGRLVYVGSSSGHF